MGKEKSMKLTDFNYTIGKFVTAPAVPIGMLAGLFDDKHTYIMLASGHVVRRPLAWCRLADPPKDPNCGFPRNCTVIVSSGRLQGMLGTVVGTLEGCVFMRARRNSQPWDASQMYGIEELVFVEDENYLIPWHDPNEAPKIHWNKYTAR